MTNITQRGKYLDFLRLPKGDMKTNRWYIYKRATTNVLGYIRWHNPWRQYCFYVVPDTIFNVECLKYIQEFIDEQNKEHKRKS